MDSVRRRADTKTLLFCRTSEVSAKQIKITVETKDGKVR